jgi:hypothetical protein
MVQHHFQILQFYLNEASNGERVKVASAYLNRRSAIDLPFGSHRRFLLAPAPFTSTILYKKYEKKKVEE